MVNGKQYVGQTSRTLHERWLEHCIQKYCLIDKAIHKYGKDNFSIQQIDSADTLDELNAKEIYWIEYYGCKAPNGYNVADGGAGIPVKKTAEWKRKIGLANKGNKRQDLIKYNKENKSKPIAQISLDGELLKIWSSSRTIEKAGIGNHSIILRICKGDPRRHTAYGYKWKYAEEMEVTSNVV